MPKHFNILISGIVQGVAFRWYAKEKAEQLGIKGFVTNQADGKVYIEAEGESANLKKFIGWCSQGPELAKVESIQTSPADLKNFKNFEIKSF